MNMELQVDMPSSKIPDHQNNLKCNRGSIIDQWDLFLGGCTALLKRVKGKMFLFKCLKLENIVLLKQNCLNILDSILYTTSS